MDIDTPRDVIDKYVDYLEKADAEKLSALEVYCQRDIHFVDPFNNVKSLAAFRHILREPFEQFSDVTFMVVARADFPHGAFLKWRFGFTRQKGHEEIIGVSEIKVGRTGLIAAHYDYWDAGERIYCQIPVIGPVVKFIRRQISGGFDQSYPGGAVL